MTPEIAGMQEGLTFAFDFKHIGIKCRVTHPIRRDKNFPLSSHIDTMSGGICRNIFYNFYHIRAMEAGPFIKQYGFGSRTDILRYLGRNFVQQSHMIAMIMSIKYRIDICRQRLHLRRREIPMLPIVTHTPGKISTQVDYYFATVGCYFGNTTANLTRSPMNNYLHLLIFPIPTGQEYHLQYKYKPSYRGVTALSQPCIA